MGKLRSKLSALVVFGMTFGVLPGVAAEDPFDGQCGLTGDGVVGSPWLLASESDLIQMEDCFEVGRTNYFELSQNIFIGSGYSNINRDSYLGDSGEDFHLDGKGYGIYGLKLIAPDELEVGLFGDVGDLTVKNLTIVSGAIVGGNETSVLVGEVDNLVVENVTITNDSLTCTDECGLLAARVVDSASVKNVSVTTGSFLAGDESGLLFGEVSTTTITIDTVHAVGRYQLRDFGTESDELSLGALIGMADTSDITVTNAYISLEPIEVEDNWREGFRCVGGVVGFWVAYDSDPGNTLTLKGVSVNLDIKGARHFGGAVGCVYTDNDAIDPASVVSFDFDDISVMGTVSFGSFGFTGYAGGILGYSDILDKHVSTLDVKDALIEVDYTHGYNLTDVEVNSIGETDPNELASAKWDTVNYANVYLNSTIWNAVNAGDFQSFDVDADGNDITSVQLADSANLAFDNMVAHPGQLGTDDWEHCAMGPRPVITPNYCSVATADLSGNQLTSTLGQASGSITDSDPKGFGHSLFYTVEPTLPAGMYLNPLTGEITGTPLELRSAQTYRLRKYNAYTNQFLWEFDQGSPNSYYFVLETKVPVVREVVREPVPVNQPYAGPILTRLSERNLVAGEETEITVSGERLNLIQSITAQGKNVEVVSQTAELATLRIPGLEPGKVSLKIKSSEGVLDFSAAFTVMEKEPTEIQETVVVNAGSFKGYVAIYARGYEGKRLSAKVGKDWVVVPEIVNNAEDGTLFRVVEFTGASYTLDIPIYIDRVLVRTVTLTTK